MIVIKKIIIFLISFFSIISCCEASQVKNIEEIIISSQLKEKIMASSLKVSLHRRDGKEFVAYLYAEDEISKEVDDDSCLTEDHCMVIKKTGIYYIYLYDLSEKSFAHYRTKIFPDMGKVNFNIKGSDLIVLPGIRHQKSDVFIVSQYVRIYVNAYEAYGFSGNSMYLQNYKFVYKDKYESTEFGGLIGTTADGDKLGVSIVHTGFDDHDILSMDLFLSEKDGKLHFDPELI